MTINIYRANRKTAGIYSKLIPISESDFLQNSLPLLQNFLQKSIGLLQIFSLKSFTNAPNKLPIL